MPKTGKPTRTRAAPVTPAEPLDQEDFHEATLAFRKKNPEDAEPVLTTLITWWTFDGQRRRLKTYRVHEGDNAAHDAVAKAFLASCVANTPEDLL